MTAAARPGISGLAPSQLLDGILAAMADGQSIRKHAGADYFDFITPVVFDDSQVANLVFSGPPSGAAAPPTFRALVEADLPVGVEIMKYADGSVPAGNLVQATTTQTAFASLYTVQANYLTAGCVVRVRARGLISTGLAGIGFLFRILYGGTALLVSTSIAVPGSVTNAGFEVIGDFVVTSVGATPNWEGQGVLTLGNVNGNLAGGITTMMMNTAPVVSVSSSVTRNITIDVQMSAAGGANKAQLRIMTVEIIKP